MNSFLFAASLTPFWFDVDSPDPPADDKAVVKLKSKSIPTFQKVQKSSCSYGKPTVLVVDSRCLSLTLCHAC